MQPVAYLNGLNGQKKRRRRSLSGVGLGELVVVEDNQGQRYIIDPQQQTNGLGFITDLIGAGAKVVGKLIKKGSKDNSDPQAQASPQGFLPSMMQAFSPAAASANGGIFSDLKNLVQRNDDKLQQKISSVSSKVTALQSQNDQLRQMQALKDQEQKMREEMARLSMKDKDDKTPLYLGAALVGGAIIYSLSRSNRPLNGLKTGKISI